MTEATIQKVLEHIDNYEQSVNACLTFIHIYKWDDRTNAPDGDVLFWIGKEYEPGSLTPDITIQLSKSRGLVIELKESLPKNDSKKKDLWSDNFTQIQGYDAQLKGWKTDDGFVGQQELILLVDQKLVRKVIEYIQSKKLAFTNHSKNFCIIQYSPLTGLKNGILLRIEHGKIDDHKAITNKRLYEGIPVSLEYLFATGLSKIKLLDYKPPVVYIMSILWDHVFSSMLTEEAWRQAKMEEGKRLIEITVTVQKLKEILIENFADKNSKQGIKEKWVEEALENFVRLKLAKKNKGTDEYVIKYRKRIADEHTDTNKHRVFAELLYKSGVQFRLEEFTPKEKEEKK